MSFYYVEKIILTFCIVVGSKYGIEWNEILNLWNESIYDLEFEKIKKKKNLTHLELDEIMDRVIVSFSEIIGKKYDIDPVKIWTDELTDIKILKLIADNKFNTNHKSKL